MSVEIKQENYYIAQWYVSVPPESPSGSGFIDDEKGEQRPYNGVDVMGIAWREPDRPENEWTMRYRFRYYLDREKDPFKTEDIKNWYEMRGNGPEDKVFREITETFALLADRMGGKLDTIEVHGDGDRFVDAVSAAKPPYLSVTHLPFGMGESLSPQA